MALSHHQRRVVHHALSVARKKGASPKVRKALIEAGLVESNLRNLKYGDRDSRGFLQQRTSTGWKHPNNVRGAAAAFISRAQAVEGKYKTPGQLAQAVQRSAFPARYDQRSRDADQILKGSKDGGGSSAATKTIPGVDRSGDRKQAIAEYLLKQPTSTSTRKDPFGINDGSTENLLQLVSSMQQAKDTPSRKVKVKGKATGGKGGRGKVKIAPGADRPGVRTGHDVTGLLKRASGWSGVPITVTTGSRHNRLTVNGNVSDHWAGHAGDIAVPVDSKKGDRIAGAALVAAGVPRAKARRMAQRGGLYNVNYKGRRIQVIWKTNQGGNHHNHVHVGVR